MFKKKKKHNLTQIIQSQQDTSKEGINKPVQYNKSKGHYVFIGGAEDRRGKKNVLNEVVKLNNTKYAIVIPSASSYPMDLGDDYTNAFRNLGVEKVEVFDIRNKKESDNPGFLEKINSAGLVFFTGGDQVKLVDRIGNTKLLEAIKQLHRDKGITIAGTSAGAAAASNPLLYSGDGKGLVKGSIKTSEGFGFLPHITIDTHFHARRRITRLSQALILGLSQYAFGIDEDTGIIIYPNNKAKVIGNKLVTALSITGTTQTNYQMAEHNDPVSINNIQVGFLQPNIIFNLHSWKMEFKTELESAKKSPSKVVDF